MMKRAFFFFLGFVACSSAGGSGGPASNEVAFHAEQDLLPGFSYDTGLQPPSGPVQLQITITSGSSFTADAIGVAEGDAKSGELVGKPASGKLALTGKLALVGHLKVDVSGLKYDGDIPDLKNASIDFSGTNVFDPFLLSSSAGVKAPVTGTLPSIPLPGGLPGTLDLTIDPGTTLDFSLHGTCAALSGDSATYHAELSRTGTIVITPIVTLSIPVVGSKQFPLPQITVALPSAPAGVDLGTKTVAFGSSDVQGEHATIGTCEAVTQPAEDAGADVTTSVDAGPEIDAGPVQTFHPVSASCKNGGFMGTLTLQPSVDGETWASALLATSGGSGAHNNATIWRVTDDQVGSYITTTTVKVLDTTDDFVAGAAPRVISNWTAQRRSIEVQGSHTLTRRYYATVVFDTFGIDPTCDTTRIDQTQ